MRNAAYRTVAKSLPRSQLFFLISLFQANYIFNDFFVYNPSDNKVSSREVTVVRLMSDGRSIITSDGLKPGDLIVSAGIHYIENGEIVKPLPVASETNIGGLL